MVHPIAILVSQSRRSLAIRRINTTDLLISRYMMVSSMHIWSALMDNEFQFATDQYIHCMTSANNQIVELAQMIYDSSNIDYYEKVVLVNKIRNIQDSLILGMNGLGDALSFKSQP